MALWSINDILKPSSVGPLTPPALCYTLPTGAVPQTLQQKLITELLSTHLPLQEPTDFRFSKPGLLNPPESPYPVVVSEANRAQK